MPYANGSPPPYRTESSSLNRHGDGSDIVPHRTYGATEGGQPSAPRRSRPIKIQKSRAPIYLLTILLVGAFFGYCLNDTWNSGVHELLRRRWASEENRRNTIREKWNAETQAHNDLQARMLERESVWETERIAMDAERKRWDEENVEHERCMERERATMDEERRRWDAENLEHEKRLEMEHQDEVQRKQKEEQHRQEKERQVLEEENRKRSALAWDGLSPAEHCLRYATREYTARLTNVGLGLNPVEECYKKSLEIHGRQVLPVRCVDHAISGQVTGHWTIDFNEASCATFWSYIKDKGCEQRGVHRYEAPLENLQNGDDWHEMCSTTPAFINGVWHWNGPTSCVDWGKYGKWGIWLLEDGHCQ